MSKLMVISNFILKVTLTNINLKNNLFHYVFKVLISEFSSVLHLAVSGELV